MAACEKHRKTPAKGYSPCPGCEVERLQAQAKHEADCAEAYKAETEALKAEIARLRSRVLELEEALIEECGTVEELEAFRSANGLRDY